MDHPVLPADPLAAAAAPARTLLALTLALAACVPDDQRTSTLDPDARAALAQSVQAQLDSGNAAFRAGDLMRA